MKVSNSVGTNVNNVDTTKSGKVGTKKTGSDLTARGREEIASSAKVNVSDRAQAMQKAKDIASNTSVDEAKVARLQKLIDEGKYKVDANAVADKLVDDHLMFPE